MTSIEAKQLIIDFILKKNIDDEIIRNLYSEISSKFDINITTKFELLKISLENNKFKLFNFIFKLIRKEKKSKIYFDNLLNLIEFCANNKLEKYTVRLLLFYFNCTSIKNRNHSKLISIYNITKTNCLYRTNIILEKYFRIDK
jgi:hypothetical protein